MVRKLRAHFFHNVVGYIALFFALGSGSAFAVVAANQINSASIIDGQVKRPDLASNSVDSGKVVNDSLTGQDVKEQALRIAAIRTRARGFSTLVVSNSTIADAPFYPLRGNTWTQMPDESDEFFGQVRFSQETDCHDAPYEPGTYPNARVVIFIDGQPLQGAGVFSEGGNFGRGTHTLDFRLSRIVFERGVATHHTLTAKVVPASCNEPITVYSLKLNVLSLR